LKLPRQLADTLKENAYISELLAEEKRNVNTIFTFEGDIGKDGLLRGGLLGEKIFQTPVESKNSNIPEAREQHGQIIAVQYSKGKAPRFCGIRNYENSTPSFFPNKISIDEVPLKKDDSIKKIESLAEKDGTPWENTVVLYNYSKCSTQSNFSVLSEFLIEDSNYTNIWYICVPAIIYEWGRMTLTETIINNKNLDWNFNDYLKIITDLLSGINALHSRKIIHADIRPSNIMCVGNPENPAHYKLIDYGSFNQYDQEYSDKNILGPTLSRERISPFYSNERKNFIERENSDTSIFINSPENEDYIIILLGWRNDLIENEKIKQNFIEEAEKFKFNYNSDNIDISKYDQNLLIPGDKIQIRKYIFHVVDTCNRIKKTFC